VTLKGKNYFLKIRDRKSGQAMAGPPTTALLNGDIAHDLQCPTTQNHPIF